MAHASTQKQGSFSTELYLEVTTSDSATIAILSGYVEGENYQWTGTAKRFPGDKFMPNIGRKLAIGRAFASAGRQLEKQGNGLVKSQDHNRAASAASRLAKAKKAAKVEKGAVSVHRVAARKASARTTSPKRGKVQK